MLSERRVRACLLVAMLSVIAIGTGLRLLMIGDALWGDEALWVIRLYNGDYLRFPMRPVGFMALSEALMKIHSHEVVLRLPPLLFGILAMPAAYLAARQLLPGRATAFFALVLCALSPWAVAFAKEWKPYSIELCAHLGLIWLVARYWRSRTTASLAAPLVAVPLLLPVAYSIVFAIPSTAAVLLYGEWRQRRGRRFAVVAAWTGLLGAVLLTGWLLYVGRHNESTSYWGGKYGVFAPERAGVAAKLAWMAGQYRDVSEWAGLHPLSRNGAGPFTTAVFLLNLAGIAWLATTRRWLPLVVLLGPVALLMAANWMGHYPFGRFRTDLFVLAYMFLLPAAGVEGLIALAGARVRTAWRPAVPLAAVALLCLWGVSLDLRPYDRRWISSGFREALSTIIDTERAEGRAVPGTIYYYVGKGPRLLSFYGCFHADTAPALDDSFATRDDNGRCRLGPRLVRLPRDVAGELRAAVSASGEPVWVLLAHRGWREYVMLALSDLVREGFTVEASTFAKTTVIRLSPPDTTATLDVALQ